MRRVGIQDSFGRSGDIPELLACYKLTPEEIVVQAKAAIEAKKG